MIILKKENCVDIGLVLALSGISCMAMIKGVIGENFRWLSIFIFVISLILIFIGRGNNNKIFISADACFVLFYGLISVMLSAGSNMEYTKSGAGLYYQIGYLLQFVLVINIFTKWNGARLLEYGSYFNCVFIIMALLLVIKHPTEISGFNNYISDDGIFLFDREALGRLSFGAFVFSLFYEPKNNIGKTMRYCNIILSIFIICISTRRSIMVAALLSIFMFSCRYRDTAFSITSKKILKLIPLVVIVVCIICGNEKILELIANATNRFVNGFLTYFSYNTNDMAVDMRVGLRNELFDKFNNMSLFEFVFGNGYMSAFVDFPLLQSFYDMGIFGGCFFIFTQIFIPCKYLLITRNDNNNLAIKSFVLLAMVESFANGFPYGVGLGTLILIKIELNRKMLT